MTFDTLHATVFFRTAPALVITVETLSFIKYRSSQLTSQSCQFVCSLLHYSALAPKKKFDVDLPSGTNLHNRGGRCIVSDIRDRRRTVNEEIEMKN